MTDECIVLAENGIQKARSLHFVTPKEKFLISELEKAREFPWNNVAENLKSAIETHQDQGSFGHRRMHLTCNRDEDGSNRMEAQEHREQRKVRLNETLSSEMSKRQVVKAKLAHPSMITPIKIGIDCSP